MALNTLLFHLLTIFITQTTCNPIYCTNLTSVAIKTSFKEHPSISNTSDYLTLVQNSDIFVDKSLLLEAILADPEEKLLALLAPEKWGKTINLRMIEHFTRIPTDSRGIPIDLKDTPVYKLFRNNEIVLPNGKKETLRQPLLLTRNAPGTLNIHMGKHPTIYVNLSPLRDRSDYNSVMSNLSNILGHVFKQHSYLQEVINNWYQNESLSLLQKIELNSTLEEFTYVKEFKAETSDLIKALRFLSQLLHKYFKSRVIILLDDYDILLDILLDKNIPQSDKLAINNVLTLLFLHTFEINTFLFKGILTGRHEISKLMKQHDLFTEYKSVVGQTFEFYGFLQRDVDTIFDALRISQQNRAKAQNWYQGYRINSQETSLRFDPASIVNFINHKSLKHDPFRSDKLLEDLIQNKQVRKSLMNLIFGNYESFQLCQLNFDNDGVDYINKAVQNETEEFDGALPVLYAYLCSSGYLTTVNYDTEQAIVRLANNKARFKMANIIISFYTRRYNIPETLLSQLTKLFNEFIQISGVSYPDVEMTMQKLVDNLHIFDEKYKQNDVHIPIDNSEIYPLMRVILHSVALNISHLYDYRTLTPRQGIKSFVTLYKDKRATMIDLMIDTPIEEILSLMSARVDVMDLHTRNDILRWIGIRLGTDGKINIMAKTEQRE